MSNNIQESKMKASEIPIDFVVPEGALGMFVSNVVVQHTKEEFTLSFFQIQHPADPGGETPEKVRALLVSRVILSPARMKEFIRVVERNYKRYEEAHTKPEDEEAL